MPNKLYHTDKIGFDIETTYQVFSSFLLVMLYFISFVVFQLSGLINDKIGEVLRNHVYITYIF